MYTLGNKVPKRDKFGIFLKVENIILDTITISIDAALNRKDKKKLLLYELRIKIETLKQLVRAMNDLKIIEDRAYLILQTQLQEISKMATGWMKYLET